MLESLFNKDAGLRPVTLLKRDSGTGISPCICQTFKNTYVAEHLRTAAFAIPVVYNQYRSNNLNLYF